MATNLLMRRLNQVKAVRYLERKEISHDFNEFARNEEQEKKVLRDTIFNYLKKTFVGCKIRPGSESFSVGLDGAVHRRAAKLRRLIEQEPDWLQWFSNHHQGIYRTLRNQNGSFQGGNYYTTQTRGEKKFLYVPFLPHKISGYDSFGSLPLYHEIDHEYQRDMQLSEIYDEATELIEAEVQRRQEEKARILREEMERYNSHLQEHLYKSALALEESQDPEDRLFARKFKEWARENHAAPRYAVAAGVREMVTVGMKVRVLAPTGSEDTGWFVTPPFEGHPEDPEGYEFQGWGPISAIDTESERSNGGASPIVVADHLYTEFRLEYWQHLLPEGYAELLEVTNRLRAEAAEEIEPFLEQEREAQAQRERMEAERQEALRVEEEERQRQLTEQLREQQARDEAEAESRAIAAQHRRAEEAAEAEARVQVVEPERMPEPPTPEEEAVQPNPDLTQAFRQQVSPVREEERATTYGLYENMRAIPLERYVAIDHDGNVRRFASYERGLDWLGVQRIMLHNYFAPYEEIGEVYE